LANSFSNGLNFEKMYELCIPYTVSEAEKLRKCQSFNNVSTYRSTHICEYDDLEGYSSFTIFIVGLLVIIVFIFSFTVIYYNVYVSMTYKILIANQI
jgi:hypothetical protein